jgi:hypothetical protein
MTRAERDKILAQELIEFKEQYAAEAKRMKSGWVDARLLLTTGIMLGELERARLIERTGTTYRPLR